LPGEGREEEAEGMVGAGGVCQQRESPFSFQVPLKPTLPHGRAGPGGSPNNERVGRGMGGSQPCEGGLGHPQATHMSPKLLACLNSLLG
jgi:hypothetical protein